MSSTPKLLIPGGDLAATVTLLYTSPSNGKGTWIDKATAVNHSAAARSINVFHVPTGGSAANNNLVVSNKSIAVNATDQMPELVGKFMPPGAMLYGNADTAGNVAFEVNGRELT